MISTSAFKLRSKFMKVDDPRCWQGENEACTLRMYETHFPGFCYLRDGKYRQKIMNINKKTAVSIECSKKIKALLFTDNELDIQKVLCLHLLGTHVQNRRLIRREDGTFCTLIKSHNHASKRFTQRPIKNEKDIPSIYDEILPRYVLEIRVGDNSLPPYPGEIDSHVDDETVKKKLPQVNVYINNNIRAIISSAIEALEAVNSTKLNQLIALARDPEKLRSILSQKDIQQFMTEIARSHLVRNPTAYNAVMTYPAPENVLDSDLVVARVLDIAADPDIRNVLSLVRKTICRTYEELVLSNILPGKKKRIQGGKGCILWNISKTSFLSGDTSLTTSSSGFTSGGLISDYQVRKYSVDSREMFKPDDTSQMTVPNETNLSIQKVVKQNKKSCSHSRWTVFQRGSTEQSSKTFPGLDELRIGENSTPSNSSESKIGTNQQYSIFHDGEIIKYDLKNLNNSQRILLGLKVASMKSRPVNMHQFENKKQADIASLIASIMRPNRSNLMENNILFGDDVNRRAKKTVSKSSCCQAQDLGNLTRAILSNFRHDVATAENKKRVKEFIQAPLQG